MCQQPIPSEISWSLKKWTYALVACMVRLVINRHPAGHASVKLKCIPRPCQSLPSTSTTLSYQVLWIAGPLSLLSTLLSELVV